MLRASVDRVHPPALNVWFDAVLPVVMARNMTAIADVVISIMTTNGWQCLAGIWGAGSMAAIVWMGVIGGGAVRAADWPMNN